MVQSIISSDRKTASAVIFAQGSRLAGVLIETDGTNNATIIVYDNASAASGKILFKRIVPGANFGTVDMFHFPVKAENGIYLSIAGTGAAAIVYTG